MAVRDQALYASSQSSNSTGGALRANRFRTRLSGPSTGAGPAAATCLRSGSQPGGLQMSTVCPSSRKALTMPMMCTASTRSPAVRWW